MSELNKKTAKKINTLAALFYQSEGMKFNPEKDFKNAFHPDEKSCWNKAVIAHSFINEDPEFLKYQAK